MQVMLLSWEVLEKLAPVVAEAIDPYAVCEGGKKRNLPKTKGPM